MTDQEDKTAEKVDSLEALRRALADVDAAKQGVYTAAGDALSLDHAVSQYVLARERLSDVVDGLDVESLEGVQRQREAVAESASDGESTGTAPSNETEPATPNQTEPEPSTTPAETT